VSWSVTESQGLIGGLTVSPSSGTLASGSSTTVTVSASNLLTVGGQLTVQPSGITVTVTLSLNLGAPRRVRAVHRVRTMVRRGTGDPRERPWPGPGAWRAWT